MDRGRQIDNSQNVNARWIDQFNQQGKTSVKTSNPPGGKSSFSLGWTEPEPVPQRNVNNGRNENSANNVNNQEKANWGKFKNRNSNDNSSNYNDDSNNYNNNENKANSQPAEKTSVRVKYAPGGQSNIIFGNDQTNYDDFKKNSGAGLYRK